MRTVAHAYRDGSGTLQSGQTFSTASYDGKGRRVKKAVSGTGTWDCTYTYLYDADSTVETRNGSGTTIQQHVWGTRYVDELVQVASEADSDTSGILNDGRVAWALQDANYNVLGLVDSSGVLQERYQYTPYGQRQVFFDAGTNDVGCHALTLSGVRLYDVATGLDVPYALCDAGHQGLLHDEESGLVYNRARTLHAGLGRFAQRDPLGYHDGLSLFAYEQSNPFANFDPSGKCVVERFRRNPGYVTFNNCPQSQLAPWRVIPEQAGAGNFTPNTGQTYETDGITFRDWPAGYYIKIPGYCTVIIDCTAKTIDTCCNICAGLLDRATGGPGRVVYTNRKHGNVPDSVPSGYTDADPFFPDD